MTNLTHYPRAQMRKRKIKLQLIAQQQAFLPVNGPVQNVSDKAPTITTAAPFRIVKFIAFT
jgi:hypothetical protein